MNEEIINKLVNINYEFYQNFGAAFAETRRRIQPGVQKVIDSYLHGGDWLDIGCGSGALGQILTRSERKGTYLGLDFSEPLLQNAQSSDSGTSFVLNYRQVNLFDSHWIEAAEDQQYDGVLAFAVLHHIPGKQVRARVIHQALSLLKPGGVFIHSEWQFQNSPKLLARIQPWALIDLKEEDVETGDVLLDWRHMAAGQTDKPGLRYVHLFSSEELRMMAQEEGVEVTEEFLSDGSGGNLGLYQVWKKSG